MKESNVSFAMTRATVSQIYSPTKFQFRVELGWLWMQKLCFWILRKIGAQAIEFDTKISRLDIQYKTLIEAINKQRAELFTQYALEGKYLLMGAQDYAELMVDPTLINHMISFSIPDAVYREERTANRSTFGVDTSYVIMNLNVVIVPWMKGMIVMPELPAMEKTTRAIKTPTYG